LHCPSFEIQESMTTASCEMDEDEFSCLSWFCTQNDHSDQCFLLHDYNDLTHCVQNWPTHATHQKLGIPRRWWVRKNGKTHIIRFSGHKTHRIDFLLSLNEILIMENPGREVAGTSKSIHKKSSSAEQDFGPERPSQSCLVRSGKSRWHCILEFSEGIATAYSHKLFLSSPLAHSYSLSMISTLAMQHHDELRQLELLRLSRRSHAPLNLGNNNFDLQQSHLVGSLPMGGLSSFPTQGLLFPGFSNDRASLGMLQNQMNLASARNMLEASSRGYYASALAGGGGLSQGILSLNDRTVTRTTLTRPMPADIVMPSNSQVSHALPSKIHDIVDPKQTLNTDIRFHPEGSPLLFDFEPSKNSVIIGRTKKCYTSVGNLRLRDICLMRLPAYSKCKKKKDKSQVVSDIMQLVRESCPEGGAFIKKDASGRWHEVRDVIARERVASIFRDFLHDQYRSSSKSKVEKRREKRVRQRPDANASTSGDDTEEEEP